MSVNNLAGCSCLCYVVLCPMCPYPSSEQLPPGEVQVLCSEGGNSRASHTYTVV